MRLFLTASFLLWTVFQLTAQQTLNPWSAVNPTDATPEIVSGQPAPVAYKAYRLEYSALEKALLKAPLEFTGAGEALELTLPQADGSLRVFRMWASPLMAPELAAKYPEVRTYAGTATDGSGQQVRLGLGPQGFHGFIFGSDGRIQTIRPLQNVPTDLYMAYRMEDLPALQETLARCGLDDVVAAVPAEDKAVFDRGTVPADLRKYRTAISAQGEYSLFHGGTKQLTHNAIMTALNFITGILERDFGARLELIPNNDTLIFLDPATDPYSGALASDWFGQNPAAVNTRVGSANYDIGHVFCRVVNPPGGVYVAGIASLGGVCSSVNKARAASSLPSPIGEGFYLIVAHEMGHQFDATHTFNSCPPSADARSLSTAFEPGGGSTIMSYATTCVPDVVDDRDGYFHVASIEQARQFITQGNGAGCGEIVVTGNNAPEVDISLTNGFYIPISTPFALTGTGTDPDGDNLTYCWEQYDLGPVTPLGQPFGDAPLFRSYLPTNNPTRTFPRIQTVVSNSSDPAEYLPDYNRFINFRLTVRDGKGGVAWDAVQFRSTTQAGPFRVTYPNGSQATWNHGEYQEVTWDVANTDKAPVNCKKVNIKMSLTAGLSFTEMLAENVPNTGRYCVQVPNFVSSTARIMVEAADNVFFDISNANFKIQAPVQPDFSFCPPTLFDTVCLPAGYTTTISTAGLLGFTDAINFSAENLPPGVTATFSPNPVQPGQETTLKLDFPPGPPEAAIEITLKGASGALSKTVVSNLAVYSNSFDNLALQSPADGVSGQDQAPLLKWQGVPDANVYEIQVATNPSFAPGTIVVQRDNNIADSFKIQNLLEKGSVYYWRVRPLNECGAGPWVGPFAFATLVDVCASFVSEDIPKPITANGTPTVESKINVLSGGKVSDVNITRIEGTHTFFSDLEMWLVSPAGTTVRLFKGVCPAYNGTFNFGFDESKPGLFGCPPPKNGTTYKPVESLNQFNGQDAVGAWTLRVKDNVVSSGGSIQGFDIELCSNTALNPPVLVNNNTLQVAPGANAVILTDLLKTEDANNTDAELVYTLMTVPVNGELHLNGSGVAMTPGDQFTQVDINNGGLRYYDYGSSPANEQFCFTVTDGEGGLVKDCFNVQPFPVSNTLEAGRSLQFLLAPNPATETVRIAFGEAPGSDTRIRVFDAAGRLVQTAALAAGQTAIVLQVGQLPEGVYTVSVDNAAGSGVRKLVVR